MTSEIILGVALVALGGYVMYLHQQINMRDYIISGIMDGSIRIAEEADSD